MSSFRSSILKSSLAVSVAFTASAAAHGSTAKLIFSAENALYGSGYDIGTADGWMDESLRAAISRFQGRQKLTASGVLDPQTFKALGINAPADKTISGNEVASPAAALAQLGFKKPDGKSVAVSAPAPKPVAAKTEKPVVKEQKVVTSKPKAEPKPVATVEKKAELMPEPAKKTPAAAKPEPQQIAQVEPKPVTRPAPQPKAAATPKLTEPKAEVKQTVAATPSQQAGKPEDDASVVSKSRYELKADGTQSSLEKLGVITGNPVAPATTASSADETPRNANNTETKDVSEPRESGAGGGFFSNLFDFLFGWIV